MERTILLFGDSITAGAEVPEAERWSSLLETRLTAGATMPYRVVNAGRHGDTTGTALSRMDREVVARRPDLVMIQFGLNDGQYPVNAVRPRVERGAFDANLRRMAQLLRERTTAIVTFLANHPLLRRSAYAQTTGRVGRPTPAPPGAPLPVRPAPEENNQAYNGVIRQVAYELNAPLLDMHAAFREQDVPLADLLASDGIDLSPRGHWLYAACAASFIQRLL
jgi:lysophospholipase L1-like esterase